jgi:hypothetical protein
MGGRQWAKNLEIGLEPIRRMSKARQLALMFFLGMLVGVFIGNAIGSDGRQIYVDDFPPSEEIPGP